MLSATAVVSVKANSSTGAVAEDGSDYSSADAELFPANFEKQIIDRNQFFLSQNRSRPAAAGGKIAAEEAANLPAAKAGKIAAEEAANLPAAEAGKIAAEEAANLPAAEAGKIATEEAANIPAGAADKIGQEAANIPAGAADKLGQEAANIPGGNIGQDAPNIPAGTVGMDQDTLSADIAGKLTEGKGKRRMPAVAAGRIAVDEVSTLAATAGSAEQDEELRTGKIAVGNGSSRLPPLMVGKSAEEVDGVEEDSGEANRPQSTAIGRAAEGSDSLAAAAAVADGKPGDISQPPIGDEATNQFDGKNKESASHPAIAAGMIADDSNLPTTEASRLAAGGGAVVASQSADPSVQPRVEGNQEGVSQVKSLFSIALDYCIKYSIY
jgi:hypothetical protein